VSIDDATHLLTHHAHHPTVTPHLLRRRLWQGWALQRALCTPIQHRGIKRWPHIGIAIDHYVQREDTP
jgi:hypothetical protein